MVLRYVLLVACIVLCGVKAFSIQGATPVTPRKFADDVVRGFTGRANDFYEYVKPEPLPPPRVLLLLNDVFATKLDPSHSPEKLCSDEAARVFAGLISQCCDDDIVSYAYGGYQFGHWAGRLGDGRACSIGEFLIHGSPQDQLCNDGECAVDMQANPFVDVNLKGSGRTPYSRGGDGRAVLRSSMREYLASIAMEALNVPTSAVLALSASAQRSVLRDPLYNGTVVAEHAAITARAAPSWTRFGTLEWHWREGGVERVQLVISHVLKRFRPHLLQRCEQEATHVEWCEFSSFLRDIVVRTAKLVAKWQSVAFCHGVMNTDNMSLLGITIDFGPFQFLDIYDPGAVCNYSDDEGRYAFGKQPDVALENLQKLSRVLATVLSEDDLERDLGVYWPTFTKELHRLMLEKLGLEDALLLPADVTVLVDSLLRMLEECSCDYHHFFYYLTEEDSSLLTVEAVERVVEGYCDPDWLKVEDCRAVRNSFSEQYAEAARTNPATDIKRLMAQRNPAFVLRNHVAQNAISEVETFLDQWDADDDAPQHQQADLAELPFTRGLLEALREPFKRMEENMRVYHHAPRADDAPLLVSCSS